MVRLVKLRMKQSKPVMRQMVTAVLLGQLNIDQAAERYKVNRLTVLRWIRKIEEEAQANKQAVSGDFDLSPLEKEHQPGVRPNRVRPKLINCGLRRHNPEIFLPKNLNLLHESPAFHPQPVHRYNRPGAE